MEEKWVNELYTNYLNNTLPPQGRANFEADVKSGVIQLPVELGQPLPVKEPPPLVEGMPAAHETETKPFVIPDDVYQHFLSGQMSDEGMKNLFKDINNGSVIQPVEEDVDVSWRSVITGEGRKVAETEKLPSWTRMPEMNSLNLKTVQNVLGTMAAGPDEIVRVIKNQYPGTIVKKDSKGNYVMKSSEDGKEYAIKPGFRLEEDLLRGAATMMLYGMGTRGPGVGQRMVSVAGTQAGIELSQEMTGGEFDAIEVPLAALFEGGGALAKSGIAGAKGLIQLLPENVLNKFGIAKKAPTQAEQYVRMAEQVGITPMTSDVYPPKGFTGKTAQAATERIPIVGTGGQRVAQQETRETAIKNVLSDYGADEAAAASDEVMSELLKKHGQDVKKYSGMKNDVIEKLSSVEYTLGSGEVPTDKISRAVNDEITRLKALGNKDTEPLITALEDVKESFTGKNLAQIEDNRKIFGEKLKSDAYAGVKTEAEKVNRKIYSAVREDMGDYIKSNGERKDFLKWAVANKRLSEGINEMNMTTLKSVLKKGEMTPEKVRSLLFSQKPSDLRRLYKNLTPKGRQSAKVAIYQEAMEKAGGMEKLSTAKFQTALNKLQKQTGVFFTKEDKQVLNGLTKALDMTKRAEVAGVSPPTGVQNFQILGALGLGAALGGVKGAATGIGIGALARAYESKPVRNLLIKIAKGRGGEQELINQLVNILKTTHQFTKEPVSSKEQARELRILGEKI